MTLDGCRYEEKAGPEYRPGNPVLFVFHGEGAGRERFVEFGADLIPEAIVVAPHGGVGDMADLDAGTEALIPFLRAHVERLQPALAAGLGYSGGATMLAAAMIEAPEIFGYAVLMHPLLFRKTGNSGRLAGKQVLVTAGGSDPFCPPDATGQLIDVLEAHGATVKSVWHPGGHEIAQSERDAAAAFMKDVRASLVDVKTLPVEREENESGQGRYLVRGPADTVAEMSYRMTGTDQIIIDHTEVPDAFRGSGTGSRLLKALMADAEKEGRKIIPLCPFAAAQFERHPEWSDRLAYRIRTRSS